MTHDEPLIFDGHNDVLSKHIRVGADAAVTGFIKGLDGHLDAPKARAGGFGGGLFAIYVSSGAGLDGDLEAMTQLQYDLPLAAEVPCAEALAQALAQAAFLHRLEAQSILTICTGVQAIRNCFRENRLAAVMHMEGAEAIDREFYNLDVLYRAGLRALGLVWSRPNIFGHGVPFCFPGSPDTGPGLTRDGIRLVKRCNALGIMIDLSHLNEAGFFDVARHSTRPLVASHSNSHAITPHSRNLKDTQLAAIGESHGLVGLNLATAMLRDDGRMVSHVPLSQIMRHLDHLIAHVGEDGVGLGSDFDGAIVPDDISDAAGLTGLRAGLRAHGYDEPLIKKLAHENWLRVLEATWRG